MARDLSAAAGKRVPPGGRMGQIKSERGHPVGRILQVPPFRVTAAWIVAWAAAARRERVATAEPWVSRAWTSKPQRGERKAATTRRRSLLSPRWGLTLATLPPTAPPWATLGRLSEAAQTGRFSPIGLRWDLPDAPHPVRVILAPFASAPFSRIRCSRGQDVRAPSDSEALARDLTSTAVPGRRCF